MREHFMSTTNLEGRNVVLEGLKRGRKIFEVVIDEGAKGDKIDDVVKEAKRLGIPVTHLRRERLDSIAKTDSHQGVIAKAQTLPTYSVASILKEEKNPFFVVVKDVLYEHNLGAILRSAAACGVDAVVVSGGKGNTLTPVVERVSMGGSNVVKVCEESILSALAALKRAGVKIVGVELTGEKNYFEEDLTGPVALVLGGEDSGLTLPIVDKCDIVVRVPMQNDMQSLNLSVTAGVLMYEKVRQESL